MRKKKPCPHCSKLIQMRSKACSSCTTRTQWKDPEQRKKKIKALKKAFPPKPRPFCVDCGIQLKTLSAERCVKCGAKYVGKLLIGRTKPPVSKETRKRLSQATRKTFQNPEWKKQWMKSIRKRSENKEWRERQIKGSRKRSQKISWINNTTASSRRLANDPKWRLAMRDNPCWKGGKHHPLWKGGYDNETQRARHHKAYIDWRSLVFERDDYICQECDKRGGSIHAHHIEPFADNPDKRYDVDNGLTVCVHCHREIHGHYIPE